MNKNTACGSSAIKSKMQTNSSIIVFDKCSLSFFDLIFRLLEFLALSSVTFTSSSAGLFIFI